MLCGYPLPEGVVAHAAAYSVHRNEEVFERAEKWLPERWMGEKKEGVKNWFWAFGSGSRGCTGKEFALQGEPFILMIYFTLLALHFPLVLPLVFVLEVSSILLFGLKLTLCRNARFPGSGVHEFQYSHCGCGRNRACG